MKVLLDTNIIVRAAQPNSPDWSSIEQALSKLIGLGGKLCLVPQNLYEFWVVATRPTNVNGFGPIEPRALPWAITLRPVGAKDH